MDFRIRRGNVQQEILEEKPDYKYGTGIRCSRVVSRLIIFYLDLTFRRILDPDPAFR
jgi:hypothetical protein